MIKIGKGRYQKVFLSKGRVIKITKSNFSFQLKRILEYYRQIKKCGIKVPDYLGSQIKNGQLFTYWEFTGKPLKTIIKRSKPRTALGFLSKILDLLVLANRQNVAFYPILEQFTVKDGEVYFVDFYPSRIKSDFNEYSDKKKKALTLKFYDNRTRLDKLKEEFLNLRPDLKNDIDTVIENRLKILTSD
jgi:hypothetical protein